jgi:UDP-glucose 4-epimerase
MQQYNCKNIIFSSTASAYNPTAAVPFNEETPTGNTTNPYATSKYIVENILRDLAIHASLHVINLRYFNPI